MGRRNHTEALRITAAGQDAQFATAQARPLGVTRHQVAAMAARGEILQVRYGVWRFTSAPGTADPAVTAALATWPSGVISHDSAAIHHGLTRVAVPAEPHVTVPHGEVRKLPGIKVHWSRTLGEDHIVRVGFVGYTSMARTVCDMSDLDDPWESLSILDDAVAAGAKRTWIHHCAKTLANGRGECRLIRDATAKTAPGEFRSWLERASAELFRLAKLPDPLWNIRVRDDRGLIGVVDALWPEWRVVCELEGLRFHTTPSQRRKDAQRFNRLQDAKYRPRRFTWDDVVHRPLEVAESLYRALRGAGADLDPNSIPREIAISSQPFLLPARRLVEIRPV